MVLPVASKFGMRVAALLNLTNRAQQIFRMVDGEFRPSQRDGNRQCWAWMGECSFFRGVGDVAGLPSIAEIAQTEPGESGNPISKPFRFLILVPS